MEIIVHIQLIMRHIPIIRIDDGIKQSIVNSLDLISACEFMLYGKENHELKKTIKKSPKNKEYVIVFYYYAVEEFGKAIRLHNLKENLGDTRTTVVDVEDWFFDHNKKIQTVKSMFGDEIDILKTKDIPLDNNFHKIEYDGKIISKSSFERPGLFLANYDCKTKEWKNRIPFAMSSQIEEKVKKLKLIIEKWKIDNSLS
ncbi:hypothetical protein K0U27_00640 [archaeon]|nr:hypothetical protein [archaeon]